MGLVTYGKNRILDSFLGDNKGTLFPATLYVALFTTAPNVSGTGGVEPTGNGYARVAVANTTAKWGNANLGSKSNADAITFPTCTTASWGTITHWGFFDAATSGNVIYFAALTSPLLVTVGATPYFSAGGLVISAE